MSRLRTTIELSSENHEFWGRLPHGEGKRLINYLLDEVRKVEKEQKGSIHNLLGKVLAKQMKLS